MSGSPYPGPKENYPQFNGSNYTYANSTITLAQADARYLQLTGGVERGAVVFQAGLSTPSISNGGFTFTMPASSGQLALTSQIPSTANFVTTNTNQTIVGNKTFSQASLLMTDGSAFAATFEVSPLAANYIYTFPAKTGTVAMLSDITGGGYARLDLAQNWTAAQTFDAGLNMNSLLFISPTGSFSIASPSASASLTYAGVSNVTLTLPAISDTLVSLNSSGTLANKTLTCSSTTFSDSGKLLQFRVDPANAAGTSGLNYKYNTSTGNLTHTFDLSGSSTNTTWIFNANGGSIPNKENTQVITGNWTFNSRLTSNFVGSNSISSAPFYVNPQSTALTSPFEYYWSYFAIPPTTGSTTADCSTVRIAGAPSGGGVNNALRVDAGDVRLASGRLISTALGSAASPAITVGANNGLYAPSSSQIALAANGALCLQSNNAQTQFLAAGSAASPCIYLNNDNTSGFYRVAANQIGISCSGTNVATFSSLGLTAALVNSGFTCSLPTLAANDTFMTLGTIQSISGQKTFTDTLLLNDPTITAATYLGNSLSDAVANVDDPVSTGTIAQLSFNYLGAKTVSATSATTYTNAATLHITNAPVASTNVTMTNRNAIQVDAGNIRMTNGRLLSTALGAAATPALAIGAALNDGIYSSAAGNINVTAGGTLRTTINSTNVLSTVRFQGPLGTTAACTFGVGAANTGMFGLSTTQIGFVAAGSNICSMTSTQVAFPVAGSATTPSVYLSTDTTTGLYRPAANQIGATVSGAAVLNVASTGLTVTGKTTTTTLQIGTGATIRSIQTGISSSITNIAAGAATGPQTVTFAAAFTNAPVVTATVRGDSGGAAQFALVTLQSVTTANFTYLVCNVSSGSTITAALDVHWTAIGQ